jgi:tetratricopeptide (TPR) repeat protein
MGSQSNLSNFSNSSDQDCISNAMRSIIQSEGVAILDNPKKVRALLSDYCPGGDHKREIVLLERLLDEKVHSDIIRQKDSVTFDILSENLTNRILANHPFDIQLVQWGIDTISVTLGVIPNVRRYQPSSPYVSRDGPNKPINPPISNNDDLISQAIRFNQTKQFHEALDIINKVIENYPNNPLALREKGFALSNLGSYEESLHWYDLSIGINPNDTITWTSKGYALSKTGRLRDAIQMYDRAIKFDSNNAMAWRSKGYCLVKLHDDHSAMICYQKALDINQGDPITWNLVGGVKRDWNEKLRAFDRALSLDPQYVPAMINKGWVLSKFGRFQEALTIYERVLTIDKNNRKAWDGRARCKKMVVHPKRDPRQPTHHPSQLHKAQTQTNPGMIDRIKGFFK